MSQERADVKTYIKGTLEWALTSEGQDKLALDVESVKAEIAELEKAIDKLWKAVPKDKTKPKIVSVKVSKS